MGLRMFRRKHPQKPRTTDVGPVTVATTATDPVLPDPSHSFNHPNIQALDFLIAVMRDPKVPINVRVNVAGWLAEHFPDPAYYMPPRVCIVIPSLPGDIYNDMRNSYRRDGPWISFNRRRQSFSSRSALTSHTQC